MRVCVQEGCVCVWMLKGGRGVDVDRESTKRKGRVCLVWECGRGSSWTTFRDRDHPRRVVPVHGPLEGTLDSSCRGEGPTRITHNTHITHITTSTTRQVSGLRDVSECGPGRGVREMWLPGRAPQWPITSSF